MIAMERRDMTNLEKVVVLRSERERNLLRRRKDVAKVFVWYLMELLRMV